MARCTTASIQHRMSSVIAAAAGILVGVVAVPSARAGGDPPANSGVSTLPNGYRPHVSIPGKSRPPATPAPGADDPIRTTKSNGCLAMVPGRACGSVTLGNTARASQADLARQAWKELRLPLPAVHTAPPRGASGLVGLAEWVWIPRSQWRPLTRRVSVGGAWAQVTATPKQVVITPGTGLGPVICRGSGTAYDSRRSSAQRTDCSYTYMRSSADQPGAVYRVNIRVVWGGAWVGSGGGGGVLPDISRSTSFGLRVAEAQGLYR